MKRLLCCLAVLTIFALPTSLRAEDGKVYELRTYTTHPGKLEALHARFRNHTMKIFEKHGMTNVMYWTPEGSEDTLVYLLAHDSKEAAEKSWDGFRKDPDWQKAYKASKVDGPLVKKVERVWLKTTDFSPKR